MPYLPPHSRKFSSMCYNALMATQSKFIPLVPIVVPVDDETRAMLNYAASTEGRTEIEQARKELRDGKGISVTGDYFEDMNQRISERIKKGRLSGA
jgi:hypothetical protein